jgi:nitroreductase
MAVTLAEVNLLKHAPVGGMLPALSHRWSPRAFVETPVSIEDLKTVLEAARWSASSSNAQPWRFLVGVHGSETHDKIFSALVDFNKGWAGKPSVLILGLAMLKDAKGRPNSYAMYDLGQAVSCLTTQATALGLATHSMGGFDHDTVRREFGLTEDYGLGAVTAVGYQGEPQGLANEQLLEREVAPRERKPLSEIALTALGVPFKI